jgi:hypothetical protein
MPKLREKYDTLSLQALRELKARSTTDTRVTQGLDLQTQLRAEEARTMGNGANGRVPAGSAKALHA